MALQYFQDTLEKPWLNVGAENLTVYNLAVLNNLILVEADPFNNFYAEGSWSALMQAGGNAFTLSTNACTYQKIGNLVYISAELIWTSKGSASGVVTVSLPFAASLARNARIMFTVGLITNIGYTHTLLVAASGGNQAVLFRDAGNTTSTSSIDLTDSAFGSTGQIQFAGVYAI